MTAKASQISSRWAVTKRVASWAAKSKARNTANQPPSSTPSAPGVMVAMCAAWVTVPVVRQNEGESPVSPIATPIAQIRATTKTYRTTVNA